MGGARQMNAVANIRCRAGGAAAQSVGLRGSQRQRDIVRRIGKYERFIERALIGEHHGRDDDNDGKYHHELDQCKSSASF